MSVTPSMTRLQYETLLRHFDAWLIGFDAIENFKQLIQMVKNFLQAEGIPYNEDSEEFKNFVYLAAEKISGDFEEVLA